ncbi:MAG TPA: hypothetical protein VH370_07695 [Humisphaera sp.]|jgi:chromosome segregation ATPase|nr:hypothetical protein [Humisphaera sp.]
MRHAFTSCSLALVISIGSTIAFGQNNSDPSRQKVNDAQAKVTKDQKALAEAKNKVKAAFEGTSEWTDATTALKDAQAKFESLTKPIIEALQTKPAYMAAVAKKKAAEEKRDKLRNDPSATPDQITKAASEVLADGNAVSKMERDALAADPSIAEAKTAIATANSKIVELKKTEADQLKSDKDVAAAQKQIDDDQTALAQARKEYAAAQAAQAAAQANSGGGGGNSSRSSSGGGGRRR